MRNLLVTLADRNFLDQAKQLFSSVYWNAGWQGDYMLLAHEVPAHELQWFREKGILTRDAMPLFTTAFESDRLLYPVTVTSKLHVFSVDFKKWDSVIFVDADCIVRYPLDALTRTKRFSASRDWLGSASLEFQTKKPADMAGSEYSEKFTRYNLLATAFNTGLFAFNTSILDENTLPELEGICRKYHNLGRFPEQLWMNLYFYKRWRELPLEYNLFASYLQKKRKMPKEDIDGVVLHFPRFADEKGLRCWDKDNEFYEEWKGNLDRAELIDLKNIPKPNKRWPGIRHITWEIWKLRFALRKDYLGFYRNKLRLRTRLRGVLGAPARVVHPV